MSTSVSSTEGLRTFNATVMLMLLLTMMLISWYFRVELLHGVGPGPALVPVTQLWPAGATPFDHLVPAGVTPPAGH